MPISISTADFSGDPTEYSKRLAEANCQTSVQAAVGIPKTPALQSNRQLPPYTVFYSWQSDLSRKYTRDFIMEACKAAIAKISLSADFVEAPRLDHDTLNVPGLPDIPSTIQAKISECGIFIADVSFVGKTVSSDQNKKPKLLSNPNVLLELGYASAKIGWERIILVMNTFYGSPEELPFDLKHRRFPITFSLGTGTKSNAEQLKSALVEDLQAAIQIHSQTEHQAINDLIGGLDKYCLQIMQQFGWTDGFVLNADPKPWSTFLSEVPLDMAITRLLSLKLLKCVMIPQHKTFLHHWTYLGKLVLNKVGLTEKPPDPPPPQPSGT